MTNKTTAYNGWVNFQTWCVYTWLTNDASTYNYIVELINGQNDIYQSTQLVRDFVEESNPFNEHSASLYSDLLTHSLQSVEWRDIALAFAEQG